MFTCSFSIATVVTSITRALTLWSMLIEWLRTIPTLIPNNVVENMVKINETHSYKEFPWKWEYYSKE